MSESYQTIDSPHRFETPKVKGSRFIGAAAPATTSEAAEQFVVDIRREFHDARHVASAWRIGTGGTIWRFNDDGEPSGSAGRPILREIEGRALEDVAVTVVRYFGGVKLGVGGLSRAYGDAAAGVLDGADTQTVPITCTVTLRHAYEATGAIQALSAATGFAPTGARYEAEVEQVFDIPPSAVAAFEREAIERTAGQVTVTIEEPSR